MSPETVPADIHAEQAVLGAMLTSVPAVARVLDDAGLETDDYYLDGHRKIHRAIQALHVDGVGVDELTVAARLEQDGELEAVGGRNALAELAASVDAPGNAREHAELVLGKSRSRQAAQFGEQVVKAATAGSMNGEIERAAERLLELTKAAGKSHSLVKPKLYSIRDLEEIPPPEYLLAPFIRESDLNVMIGKPGTAKSFFALALSLHIASGTSWLNGSKVQQGPVVYNAAEGFSGIAERVAAWSKDTGTERPEDFFLWPLPVNFFKGETANLELALAGLEKPPKLIVVDTMARSMAGGNENQASDVGLVVDNLMRVCQRFGAAALLIHHIGKDGKDGRGSNSLEGASATMLKLELDGTNLRILSHRDKEAPAFKPWKCHLEQVGNSAVIRPGADLERLQQQQAELLATVSDAFGTAWASTASIREASGLSKTSLHRTLKALCDANYLESRQAGSQSKEYRIASNRSTVPNRSNRSTGTGKNRSTVTASLEAGTERLPAQDNGTLEKKK